MGIYTKKKNVNKVKRNVSFNVADAPETAPGQIRTVWENTGGLPTAEDSMVALEEDVREMMSLTEDIADAFHFYDSKGDKKIAAHQIGNCLRSLNLAPTESLVSKMTQQWANNMEARVSVEEFTPIYHNVKKECGPPPSVNVYLTLLAYIDRDQNGTVMVADLRTLLQNAGEKLSPLEVDSLLFGVDDNDGKIKIEDLVKHIMSQ